MRMTEAGYKRLSNMMAILVICANGIGAMLTSLYFIVIDPMPAGTSAVTTKDFIYFIPTIVGTMILLAGGTFLTMYIERLHPRWVKFLLSGGAAEDVPLPARISALNYPLMVALASISMWLIAGVFFSSYGGRVSQFRNFIGIFVVGGVLTCALIFFAFEILWRPVVLLFFPDGRLRNIPAVRLTVFGRLLIAFSLVTLYPAGLVSVIAIDRARFVLSAPNPESVIANLIVSVIFILIIGLVAGIGLAAMVTGLIVRPLNELEAAMTRVENNDLHVQVPVYSNDEIGYLTERFNAMVAGLRRGELLRTLLNLYVSPEVAHEAVEHGTQLGGQLVECSVLFSDIRGFTTISEQLAPDVLMDLLNRYMSTMVDVIVSNGGMVNKFGGDSLLAVFGTPLNPSITHAWNAVKSALDMRLALEKFNQMQVTSSQLELNIGIGIATGKVVAGNIGGQGRIEYTVIGDTVNLASRLQSMTKEVGFDILINEAAHRMVHEKLSVGTNELPPVEVRGKKELVNVFGLN